MDPDYAFFVSRLAFTTNTFSIPPSSSTTARANEAIHFRLPASSIVNLKSLALTFGADMAKGAGRAMLPAGIESLIQRVEVTCGGHILSSFNGYNTLAVAMERLGQRKWCTLTGHPYMVYTKTQINNGDFDGTNLNEGGGLFSVGDFINFLGTASPSFLDTSLLPPLEITFYTASNNVCADVTDATPTTNATGANPVFSLSRLKLQYEAVSFLDSAYSEAIAGALSQPSGLEITFKDYVSVRESTSSGMRFSVSTQSLDRIWVVHHNTNVDAIAAPVLCTGHASSAQAAHYNGDLHEVKLFTTPFIFTAPASSGWSVQCQINGSNFPNFPAGPHEAAVITKASVPNPDRVRIGLNEYNGTSCVQCFRLNKPGSEDDRRISGLDTRGISLQGLLTITGKSSATPVSIFLECTRSLKVGMGQQIEVLM